MTKQEMKKKIGLIIDRFSIGGMPRKEAVDMIMDLIFWKQKDKT